MLNHIIIGILVGVAIWVITFMADDEEITGLGCMFGAAAIILFACVPLTFDGTYIGYFVVKTETMISQADSTKPFTIYEQQLSTDSTQRSFVFVKPNRQTFEIDKNHVKLIIASDSIVNYATVYYHQAKFVSDNWFSDGKWLFYSYQPDTTRRGVQILTIVVPKNTVIKQF